MKLWIARCESGHLQLFEYRPTYNGKMWVNGWTSSIPLDDTNLKRITMPKFYLNYFGKQWREKFKLKEEGVI